MTALGAGLKELVFFKVFWDWSEMTILRAGLKWLLLFLLRQQKRVASRLQWQSDCTS